jgi:ATP-dependent Clp protease protease subunit
MKNRHWYSLKNLGRSLDLFIFGVIGPSFFDDGVSAKPLVEELARNKDVDTINVRINSPGGNVFEGLAIANALASHPATVNVSIESVAASIASIIALAGDHVTMAENALFMIHEAEGCVCGRADDVRKFADLIEKTSGVLALTYVNRTGKAEAEVLEMMAAETWFTAAEALEHKFIDEVTEQARLAACVDPRIAATFKRAPESLKGLVGGPDMVSDVRALPLTAATGKSVDHARRALDIAAVE